MGLPISEAAWQEQVIQLAHVMGWKTMHVRRSIGKGRRWTTATSVVGWPDLTCWHERQGRLMAIELKVHPNKPTVEQLEVLRSLIAAGVETHVFYPEDLPHLQQALSPSRTRETGRTSPSSPR